mmetsp:Transcript_35392/g.56557  ORF Transcript_35392/g.56557 Transcript_35392/m.56557 type:complete len:144 (+) Transcript_35392:297-728(+)
MVMKNVKDTGQIRAAAVEQVASAVELFVDDIIKRTAVMAKGQGKEKIDLVAVKSVIAREEKFDFLRSIESTANVSRPRPRGKKRVAAATEQDNCKVKKLKEEQEDTGAGSARFDTGTFALPDINMNVKTDGKADEESEEDFDF